VSRLDLNNPAIAHFKRHQAKRHFE